MFKKLPLWLKSLVLWLKGVLQGAPQTHIGDEHTQVITPSPSHEETPILVHPSKEGAPEVQPQKPRKPYITKPPTESPRVGKERSQGNEEGQVTVSPRREEIKLGTKRRKPEKPKQHEEETTKKSEKTTGEKKPLTRVASPYVEINLDNFKVFLVLPEQQFQPDATLPNIPAQLDYQLELNVKAQSVKVTTKRSQGIVQVEERRIELETPLNSFRITFPDELKGKTYGYAHNNGNIFVFVDTGNSRGRMHWLYDKNNNPIPEKVTLVLLNKHFILKTQPDVEYTRCVWEDYQCLQVNLKEKNELVVSTPTGEELRITCKRTFSIEGEKLVGDDFREQSPLFTGNSVKIRAPEENPLSWRVWIQNKRTGYKIVDENWNGSEPLELKLPEALPCECGEFQIDICEQDERLSEETLFFRYIPSLQLEYPKELIVPDPDKGHKPEIIKVILGHNFKDCELKTSRANNSIENGYKMELPPEEDILEFSIGKKALPETEIRLKITIPRLKWRTSEQETWFDRPLKVKRKELVPGKDIYLCVKTNDFDTGYDIVATLEENGKQFQLAKFSREGLDYKLLLNQFYDTVKNSSEAMALYLEIYWKRENEPLHKLKILNVTLPIFQCKLCSYKIDNEQSIQLHIKELHLLGLVIPLTYEELHKYVPDLPKKNLPVF